MTWLYHGFRAALYAACVVLGFYAGALFVGLVLTAIFG